MLPSSIATPPSSPTLSGPPQAHLALLETAAIVPEPGSINAILREHNRSRLFVHPIAWTMEQPRLLSCRFGARKLHWHPPGLDDDESVAGKQNAKLRQERIELARQQQNFNSIATSAADLPRLSPVLAFSFGGRAVRLRTDGIFALGSTDCFLAYLYLDTVDSLRRLYVYGRPYERPNEPMMSLKEKKLGSLQPLNAVEDPYIMATLIALAQEQRRQIQETTVSESSDASSKVPDSFKVPQGPDTSLILKVALLVITVAPARVLYAYKAVIPTAFLDKFESLARCTSSGQIKVSYSKLRIGNPEGLIDRLPWALGLSHEQCQSVAKE
ncbi:hypothetical protein C8A00DRAFT_18142 [Chaetomidium leptoderma]|uniref:Uncharacterized protein n=1 Tax=Chaetomidium leptoderma TaxID=669021 RepID=A0AAN6ZVF4_9PEZI|nr:hypothetical protein C8A00DRAFT_18142 [Chaetomidium leptoderma]